MAAAAAALQMRGAKSLQQHGISSTLQLRAKRERERERDRERQRETENERERGVEIESDRNSGLGDLFLGFSCGLGNELTKQ